MRTHRLAPILAAAFAAAPGPSAAAQESRTHIGAGPVYVQATGSLANYLAGGYGLGAFVIVGPESRPLKLRIDAEYLWFPSTTRNRPYTLTTPAIITTGSGIFTAAAGPRLRIELGRVQLSAALGAGIARLSNTGSVSLGIGSNVNRATTFSNLTYALSAGPEASLRLGNGAPVRLALSARYLFIGSSPWLREGNLPVGIISGAYLNPTWSVAAMWVYRLSITVPVAR